LNCVGFFELFPSVFTDQSLKIMFRVSFRDLSAAVKIKTDREREKEIYTPLINRE